MERKRVLWLVSWYPNRNDKFDGDFVQRHARAAAIYHDVHVLFVTHALQEEHMVEEWHEATGLTEQLIYFQQKPGVLARLKRQWTWNQLFRRAVEGYISRNGLPDLVHVHIPWKAGLIAWWLKRKYRLPFMVTEHWGMYQKDADDPFFRKPLPMRRWLQRIFREASTLVTVSRFLGDQIKAVMGRKADFLIPNVVDTSLFFYQEEKYQPFTFIHVSNMAPVKNVPGLLQAFQKILAQAAKPVQLVLVGNRDQQMVKEAERLGGLHASVFFRGELSYVEVAEEMRRAHALVLFSRSETFSCVTAEALCAGLPVVATAAGALPELVDEHNGLLVPPGNVDALAAAMWQMMEQYAAYDRRAMAAAAARKYGYGQVAEQFAELYKQQG